MLYLFVFYPKTLLRLLDFLSRLSETSVFLKIDEVILFAGTRKELL
ncbi:hypothetical protein ES705_50322 [subsurface metagenome]